MCHGCWEEAGSPETDTPEVREAARLIAAVYAHSCVGGNLHIVLDDYNVEDYNLGWCAGLICAGGFPGHGATPEQLEAEDACVNALSSLSERDRVSAIALHHGCWS